MRKVLGAWLVIVFLVLGVAIAEDVEQQRVRNAFVGMYYANSDSDTVAVQVEDAGGWWDWDAGFGDLFWWLRK